MILKLNTPLHHAHCIEGDWDIVKDSLFNFLEKEIGFKTTANPDLWLGEFEKFGIDESRVIIDFQNKKSLGERKIIVIKTDSITHEAQNSLLKTLEEPTPNTHFFLILQSSEILLPTLKSRLVIESVKSDKNNFDLAESFLKADKSKRIEILKEIIEEKNKPEAIKKLNELEMVIRERLDFKKISSEEINFLKTLNKFRGYLNDRAPSFKMLLEHLALIAPEL